MLSQLKIQNLILVDKAEIFFGPGFNILTGETGSGKSAILSAIGLIAGDRADSQLVGKNGDLAVVEATLQNLSIRRELHKSGKSRCFINDNLVQLSELREIVGSSIELVNQSSAHLLASVPEQRNILDCFGNTIQDAKILERAFFDYQALQKRQDELKTAQETRSRDLAWAIEDLCFIEEVAWKNEEDEKLTQEHRLATSASERFEKIGSTITILEELALKKAINMLEVCARLDNTLTASVHTLKSASLEIDETRRLLLSYIDQLNVDPKHLEFLEKRIAKIEQIKRRFGKTFEDVVKKKQELQNRIETLKSLDQELDQLNASTLLKQEEIIRLATALSKKRKQAAKTFAEDVLQELKTLNLIQAQFLISFTEEPMSPHGCDAIRFLFSANAGHQPIPLENCASGGELSRLLLAIKTLLAEKEKSECLVFDEIDSNVGGQTASILGEKLKTLGKQKQVICVTHFAQVARFAAHHFVVAKTENENRVTTNITALLESAREKEYHRMLGIK